MKSYIIKPKSVKKSEIVEREYIFSASRHSDIQINSNFDFLVNLINISKKSVSLKNQKKYFNYVEIGSINTTTGYVEPTYKKSIDISTDSVYQLQKDDILISTVRTYLGGIGIVNQKEQDFVASKALIVLRELKKDINKYYLFGILRTSFFIEQTNLILNDSMYPRMDKDSFDKLKIPFPTITNHTNPEKVETLVSLIVQNIIDKEKQIKLKNKQIDELIEKELRENQKAGSFSYSYPKISDLKEETRLDTGIYEREFKKMSKLIENYSNGNYFLNEKKISPGVTPKDYYFSDYKRNKNFHDWVTPKNINQRQLAFHTYIFTKTKSKVQDNSLILNGIRYVGNGIFVEKGYSVYTNQNTLIINQFEEKFKQLFLLCFLTSDLGKKMQMIRRNFGIVPILYTEHLCKIPIPNFSESKQQSIAKLYYNPLEKNKVLDLENYLEKEQARNREIGIFQLNMEIFELREQLEDLVHKIVMEEKIEIS